MNRAERRRLEKLARKQSKKDNLSPQQPADNSSIQQTLALAKQFHQAGKYKQARDLLQHLQKQYQLDTQSLNLLGILHFQLEDYRNAEAALRKAIQLAPNDADTHNNLGTVYEQLNQLEKAINHYKQAISLNANHQNAFYNLGNAHKQLGNFDDAVLSFKEAIRINPYDRDARYNLASTYSSLSLHEKALNIYATLQSSNKPDAQIAHNIGTQLMALGRFAEAEENFRQAISIDPADGRNYRLLTRLKKYSSEADDDVVLIQSAFAQPDISNESKAHLAFALGGIFEGLSQYQQAFEFLLLANQLQRDSFDYSIETDRKYFSDLKEFFTSLDFDSTRLTEANKPKLIFIVGMPRSGTSLIEQIISSHPRVFGAGELENLTRIEKNLFITVSSNTSDKPEFQWDLTHRAKARDNYLTAVRNLSGNSEYVTDKMPHNFKYIGFIKLMFPDAMIIHAQRNPLDNCLSIFKNYFSADGHRYSWNLKELGQYYREYRSLMSFWNEIFPADIYPVQYENVVADTENQVRELLSRCGLEWDDACLQFHKTERSVRTASSVQVRQQIYTSSVNLSERYGDALNPLKTELALLD